MTRSPSVLLDDQLAGALRLYENPVDIITVYAPDQLVCNLAFLTLIIMARLIYLKIRLPRRS